MLAGGSPCQQLAVIGQRAGQLGLRGRGSVNYFVFPALAWVIQRRGPDLHIHVLEENAGTMVEVHKEGMMRALGIPMSGGHGAAIDAGKWAAKQRDPLERSKWDRRALALAGGSAE